MAVEDNLLYKKKSLIELKLKTITMSVDIFLNNIALGGIHNVKRWWGGLSQKNKPVQNSGGHS